MLHGADGHAAVLREALRRKTGMRRFAYGGTEVRTDEEWGRIARGWAVAYDARQRRSRRKAFAELGARLGGGRATERLLAAMALWDLASRRQNVVTADAELAAVLRALPPLLRDAARTRYVRYRQGGFDMQTRKAEA